MRKLQANPRRPRRTERHGSGPCSRASLAIVAAGLLLAATSALATNVGDALADALHELQQAGVRVIFSSQTITPDLRVIGEIVGATPEERLRSLLAPHGLGLKPLTDGGWVVVTLQSTAPAPLLIEVRSQGDDAPVRAAVVSVASPMRMAHTDRRGHARIADPPRAPFVIVVRAEGFATMQIERAVDAPESTGALLVRLAPDTARLAEIIVQTSRYSSDEHDFGARANRSRAELDGTPGTDEDLARALQQLPGAAAGGVSARTHVRGSRDNETLFRFDGVTLVDPYHLKDFQGLFSAIDPASTESTTFWTGGFPVEFGQRNGAVIDTEARKVTARTAELGLSVLNSSLVFGTPFAGDRGTFLLSGRVSNLSRISQWLNRDIGEPEFQDLLLRGTWQLGEHSSLAAGLLGLEDSIDVFSNSRLQQAHADYQDAYTWLRIGHWFAPTLSSTTLLSRASLRDARTGTLDRPGIVAGNLREEMHSHFNTLRQQFAWEPTSAWYFTAGAEWIESEADYDFASDARYVAPFYPDLIPVPALSRAFDATLYSTTEAAYLSARWQPWSRSTAELGLRRDAEHLRGQRSAAEWSLRANLRQRLTSATTLRLSWGQFSAAPWVTEAQLADGIAGLQAVASLVETNLSVEHAFDSGWLLRAEAYDKLERTPSGDFENRLSPLVLLPELEIDRSLLATTGGRMQGLELTLESDRSRELSGWLSYTLSRADDHLGGVDIPRSWDQRHALQAGLAWSHARWHVSSIFNWHSGWPLTPLDRSNDTWTDPVQVVLSYGARNSARYSDFAALDLRATYQWPFARGTLEGAVEVRNALSRANPCCRTLTVDTDSAGVSRLFVERQDWLGLTPLIGLRWRY